jgi:threonine dehydratase
LSLSLDSWHRRIEAAALRVEGLLPATALESADYLSEATRCKVWFKCDHRQPTGSFKVRGALNVLSQLTAAQREHGIITASSGNHGAAVAWGMRQWGGRATIFTAASASALKLKRIRQWGGELQQVESDDCLQAETTARAAAIAQQRQYVPPYNDPEVIAGQGTLGLELLAQCRNLDAVFITIGGGGLISGVSACLKYHYPEMKIFGCLPANSPDMAVVARGGDPESVQHLPTLSDASAGGMEKDSITIELARQLVDEYVEVSEVEIARELRMYLDERQELIEGAAGVAIAAFRKRAHELVGKNVAIILCGANISADDLQHALALSR